LKNGDPFYSDAQIAIARSLYRSGEKDKAKDFLKARLRMKENDLDSLVMLAEFAVQEKNFADANIYYSTLLEKAPTDAPERWTWFFARGIALERLKQWDKAEPDFLKALEMQPDHPEVLNYLAYSWIIEGKNVEKARDMLANALQARPNDAPIIDSYGWALYTLGKYEEAAQYLERANELMPSDPTVNDHLGDVYWKLGREREARFQWERALSFKPEPEDLEKIKNKLENGLQPSEN
jgi:Flp pilus assembly protein TadD